MIDVSSLDSLDRALKQFKKRMERSRIINELRERKHFVKPSIKRRQQRLKAIYRQQMQDKEF